MNTRPANAPNTPRATAYPMSTQNSRFWVNGGEGAGSDDALMTRTPSEILPAVDTRTGWPPAPPPWHVAVAAVLRPGLPGPVRAVTGGLSLPQNRAISPVVSAGVVGVVLIARRASS